eukprot:419579_1
MSLMYIVLVVLVTIHCNAEEPKIYKEKDTSSIPPMNCDYPKWPSPATFHGHFIMSDGNGTLKFCYDGENNRFAKHFYFSNGKKQISLIYDGYDYHWMCPGDEDCAPPYPAGSCTYFYMPRIPFPSNQFQNYTYIGREKVYQRLTNGKTKIVDSHHWVGTCIGYNGINQWATDQYFDVKFPSCDIPTMNTYIDPFDEIGSAEIRYFTEIDLSGYDENCFELLDVCDDKDQKYDFVKSIGVVGSSIDEVKNGNMRSIHMSDVILIGSFFIVSALFLGIGVFIGSKGGNNVMQMHKSEIYGDDM